MNTSFFHRSTSNHKRRNKINSLEDEGGREYKSQEDMGNHVVDYFTMAYKMENKDGNLVIRRSMLNTIPRVLGEIENEGLMKKLTREEVKNVVFYMQAFKALGPNGFLPIFFQHFWEVIKGELFWATIDFFNTGKFSKRINKSFLSLIPKIQSPKRM